MARWAQLSLQMLFKIINDIDILIGTMIHNTMTPEELQKQWFEMWNKTMKNNIFDMTKMGSNDMDDFMRVNLMKYLEYTGQQPTGKGKLGLDDRNRIANSLRTIKRELAEIERLVGQGDDSGV